MNINIKKVKIVTMVPPENLESVRTTICTAGAGLIGNYSECTTTVKSIGTFRPNSQANPYIGKKENLEFVSEERLEVICDINIAKKVIEALRKTHPYEEPEIDIIPLIDENNLR